MGLLYGRAGRLTAENGGFRPGQEEEWLQLAAACEAGLDEGLLPLSPSNLLYMANPHSYKKCQWRITARPRISTQAGNLDVTSSDKAVGGGALGTVRARPPC
jgi:hypothetical protein